MVFATVRTRPERDVHGQLGVGVTEVPTWALWLVGVISPLLTFIAAGTGVILTRRGVREAVNESRLSREQANDIARGQFEQHRRDSLMEYGKAAVDLLLSGKDDLVQRGEAMIAYLSSLPADILPAEEKNLLIAMMTVGVARGAAYPGAVDSSESGTARSAPITSGSPSTAPTTTDEA